MEFTRYILFWGPSFFLVNSGIEGIVTLQHSRISTLKVIKGISGTKGRKSPGRGNGEPGNE